MTPRLVPIETLAPAAYNPRRVDPARLEMVALSLRKLGWLLPAYATEDGQLLSGHQRSHVARDLGYRHVPVVTVPDLDPNRRKALNVLFNRATNDIPQNADTSKMAAKVLRDDVKRLGESLPDHPMDEFPCLRAREEAVGPLLKSILDRLDRHARNVARTLFLRFDIAMPVVVTESGRVVNGAGRIYAMAERKKPSVQVVRIPDAWAPFAEAMLNFLSMDFDIGSRYADFLRHNSFRRVIRVRSSLGNGFVFALGKSIKEFDHRNPEHAAAWRRKFGTRVIDFGAGHLHETEILRSMGVDCVPFEPYRIFPGRNEIDKEESLRVARGFLAEVASGKPFDSIFIASVFNSVPFEADRLHMLTICAALSGPRTRLYVSCTSDKSPDYRSIKEMRLDQRRARSVMMLGDWESDVSIGEIFDKPKAQKYHTTETLYLLLKRAYRKVQAVDLSSVVAATAMDPLPGLDLDGALAFEFDLPYPDGSRMGLVAEAREAFASRARKAARA